MSICTPMRPFLFSDVVHFRTVFAIGTVSALAGVAQASLIANGDFGTTVPSNGTGGGWTTFGNDDLGGYYPNSGQPDGCFILNAAGAASSDPTIQQVIAGLTPGSSYRLSGDYASFFNNAFPSNGNSLGIDVNGTQIFTGQAGPLRQWGGFSIDFLAPAGGQVTISFRGEINGSDNDVGIDNIALNVIPSPAAGTVLGLGGLMAVRRRRR